MTWETGRRASTCGSSTRRRRAGSMVRRHEPDRLPGPERADCDLRRVRAAGASGAADGRLQAAHGPHRGRAEPYPSRGFSTASRFAQGARCSSMRRGHDRTSRSCARAGSRARACSLSAAVRSRSRSPTGSSCRSRERAAALSRLRAGIAGDRADDGQGDRRGRRRGLGGGRRACDGGAAAGALLPGRITCAVADRACPRPRGARGIVVRRAVAVARPPEVTIRSRPDR